MLHHSHGRVYSIDCFTPAEWTALIAGVLEWLLVKWELLSAGKPAVPEWKQVGKHGIGRLIVILFIQLSIPALTTKKRVIGIGWARREHMMIHIGIRWRRIRRIGSHIRIRF